MTKFLLAGGPLSLTPPYCTNLQNTVINSYGNLQGTRLWTHAGPGVPILWPRLANYKNTQKRDALVSFHLTATILLLDSVSHEEDLEIMYSIQ